MKVKFALLFFLTLSLQSIVAPKKLWGQISGTWGASCTATHQSLYGSKPVSCPAGWCEDSSTCGCSPSCSTPVCAICTPTTGCPAGSICELPAGCQSLVCVASASVSLYPSLKIDLSRFSTTGLAHDGAIICDIYPGATSTNIEEKLKDETCRHIYRSLIKFEENYP